ncbi:MAG: DUF1819 family protein [Pirellulaceae bacterium]|nr:DUF1819 family protein [Pirellulaceae bacterium]
MVQTKLSLSFTAGGLLYHETVVVAESYVASGCDWNAALEKVESQNLLQSRTASTAKRKLREIAQRLKQLTNSEIRLLVSGTRQEQKLIIWLACCLRYHLLADFARDVVRSKYLQLDYSIDLADIQRFIEAKMAWHEELESLAPSTLAKLQTVMMRMLRESELVSDDGLITSPPISEELKKVLVFDSPEHLLLFPLAIEE